MQWHIKLRSSVQDRGSHEILFISSSDPDAGAPHGVMAAIWLRSRGFTISCVLPGPSGRRQIFTPLGILRVTSIPQYQSLLGKVSWHLRLLLSVASRRILKKPPTLFYVNGSNAAPAVLTALCFLDKRKLIYQTQDYLEPGRHPVWAFFEKRLARRAGHVICNEPNRARFMASNYGLGMPKVVRTALPRNWVVPEFDFTVREQLFKDVGLRQHERHRLVLNIGPYSSVRCSRELITAVATLPDDYILVFTGCDAGSMATRLAKEMVCLTGIEKRTIFLERMEFSEVLRYAAACDIGILLYPNDGTGNYYQAPGRLTEYMRCGLPIVASNFPGLELLTIKYSLGAVCDPYSPTDIARAIKAIGDRPYQEVLEDKRRLRILAETEFAYESQAWQIEEIVKAMMEKG